MSKWMYRYWLSQAQMLSKFITMIILYGFIEFLEILFKILCSLTWLLFLPLVFLDPFIGSISLAIMIKAMHEYIKHMMHYFKTSKCLLDFLLF